MTATTFPALKEAQDKLTAKRDKLGEIFAEAGPDMDMSQIKSLDGDSKAKAEQIAALNEELTDLGEEVDRLKTVASAARRIEQVEDDPAGEPGAGQPEGGQAKTFGDAFVNAKAHQVKGKEVELDIELKTLFETSAGWAAETTRGPRLVTDEQRPLQVAQLIPQTTTTQTAVTYMEETTFTNNAAETAEGGTKPEAALELTERSSSVRKIAVWLPITDEQLEDVPRVRQYLNNRLPFMVRQRLDSQILTGNGTAPNIEGILNVSGVQTQAKGADPTPDAVYKAITKVEVTGQAMPDAAVFHPNDWQGIRLLRTSDGVYIWGSPSEAGPERIWGLQVVKAQALTENTGLVGDFGNFTELAVRSGMTVETSNSHSTFFVENKQAVRAEIRAAFVVYRPTAFCTVTGI